MDIDVEQHVGVGFYPTLQLITILAPPGGRAQGLLYIHPLLRTLSPVRS